MNIIQKPSPNFTKNANKPEAVVLHIMAGTLTGTASWFADPASGASTHYGIGKTGTIHQYVQENDAAWHAGRVANPTWSLIKKGVNPNTYTIGIEHEGQSTDTWTDAMRKASAALVRDICTRHNIPIDRNHVIGHNEINAATRPNCPSVDKTIIDQIIAAARGETITATKFIFTKNLGVYSTGNDVVQLQKRLGVSPTFPIFGPKTRAAVIEYQKANGIDPTGFVGPITRAALNNA